MQFSASHFVNSLQLGPLRAETGRKEGRAFGLDKWSLSNSTNRRSSTLHPFGILFYRLYMLNKTNWNLLAFDWQRCVWERDEDHYVLTLVMPLDTLYLYIPGFSYTLDIIYLFTLHIIFFNIYSTSGLTFLNNWYCYVIRWAAQGCRGNHCYLAARAFLVWFLAGTFLCECSLRLKKHPL